MKNDIRAKYHCINVKLENIKSCNFIFISLEKKAFVIQMLTYVRVYSVII